MSTIHNLLAEYGESHQNETNKLVHWICVPVILWCVLALISAIPFPFDFMGLDWLTFVIIGLLVYYFILSKSLAIGMFVIALISEALIALYESITTFPIWQFALILFVVAWVGQFWGHKVEGKKPSFLKDVQFLLIGPAWLMSFIYKKLGIAY